MASVTFTPPRQWEDWASWLLGFWLLLSPWILHFEDQSAAMQNAVILGFVLILAEVITLSAFQVWEEWINVALGAWLLVSPWVLRGVGLEATTDFVIVGLSVIALAGYEMWHFGSARKPKG
ncbi:MAG TPA: SPW repeat protein [Xanthobacteraceae bacterium]